ncbi:MAG: GNAT family N-acetyltransferase [Thermomicrobiales bacterium]
MTTTTTTIETTATAEPGHAGQTFLVGEEIYLRRIEKADARYTMSWRDSIFPRSPSVTEEWITREAIKSAQNWYAIVRKADDRVVGSLTLSGHSIHTFLRFHVDPLYGEAAGRWKAEAIRLVLPWRTDEQKRISQFLTLTGDETEAIAAALDVGAFEAARTPKLILKEGERVDLVRFAHLSPAWIAELGDPRETDLVRTGSGEPRPVPAPGAWEGDPPRGAILVGQRVYLKAVDKEDAAAMARFGRQEIETGYGHFRAVNSPENHAHRRLEDNAQRLRHDIGFTVRLRENDQFIGEVAVLDVDYVNQYGETASWMYDPAFRGSGYGSEAKHLLLAYCFETLGLRAVESFVSTDNPRSAAALRKQGYQESGVLPWTSMQNGRFSGNVVFHLTAEAWRSLPRSTPHESEEATP